MVKSKLIQLLQTLSVTEFKEYGRFLEGTTYRKTSGVFQLFNYLKKFHPNYPEKKVSKEVVLKKAFKDKPLSSQRLFDLMSILYTILENFLIQKKLETLKAERDFLVLNVLKDKKLDKAFFQKASQVEKEWQKFKLGGIEQLHNIYKLHNMVYLHPNFSTIAENSISQETLSSDVDNYYYAVKLYTNLLRELNQQVTVAKTDIVHNKVIFEEILKVTKETASAEIPQVKVISNILSSFKQQDFTKSADYKDLFVEHIDHFNQYEKYDILNALLRMNHANHFAGIEGAAREMFELNKLAVEKSIIIEDGYIESEYFKLIVDVGCTVGELDWTENFINSFQDHLRLEFKEHILTLCRALLLLERNEFEKILKDIAQVKIENAMYAAQLKTLQLQCYYELDDYDDLFFNLVKSFSAFLKRNTLLSQGTIVQPYELLIKYTNKLYLEKTNIKKKKVDLLDDGAKKCYEKKMVTGKGKRNSSFKQVIRSN